MSDSERFERDRERFKKKRAEEESFVEALERLFHPILPEDQAEIDRIVKEVTRPDSRSRIVRITKKRHKKPKGKKS